MAVAKKTPLEKMQAAFPDLHQKRNGFWAHDDNPRFDAWESPEGDIRIHSWTGRSVDEILSMGKIKLSRADLYAKPGQWSAVQVHDTLDVLTLAQYMKIDHRFLSGEGYSDGYIYASRDGRKTTCVKIGGYEDDAKIQVRLSLHKEPRFLFDQGTPGNVGACGYNHLDRARELGWFGVVEGASDEVTGAFHGIPLLGVPGADHVACLDVARVLDIPICYIFVESDQAKKLRDKGQGFYKNVRSRLRENGYKGAIFAVRLEAVTGYKDPSDLHKAIYQECKETEEQPFYRDVHARFIAAIEQAIEQAIPEGNEGLLPAPHGVQPLSFEEFSLQVMLVPRRILSDRQKVILLYLYLYLRDVPRDPEAPGVQLDTDKIAFDLSIPKDTLLENIGYLSDKIGLFSKDPRAHKEPIGETGEFRYKGTDLFLRPKPALFVPRGYAVPLQDEHQPGGPRNPNPEPVSPPPAVPLPPACDVCGNPHTIPYVAGYCPPCEHTTYPPIEQDAKGETIIESSLAVVSSAVEQAQEQAIPETPKMPPSGNESLDSITDPQNGGLGKTPLLLPISTETPAGEDDAPPAQSEASYDGPNPPPQRLTYCCKAGWRWNPDGGGYECAACHPPDVQPIPTSKLASLLIVPLAAVLP